MYLHCVAVFSCNLCMFFQKSARACIQISCLGRESNVVVWCCLEKRAKSVFLFFPVGVEHGDVESRLYQKGGIV